MCAIAESSLNSTLALTSDVSEEIPERGDDDGVGFVPFPIYSSSIGILAAAFMYRRGHPQGIMTVRGRIVSMSHLGGLWSILRIEPPGLGWAVQIEGGQMIGRVDSVIGSVNSGLIHVVLSEKD